MKRLLINLFLLACLSLASAQTYVELILDASGSMWNTLDDGRYRIIAAKDVLSQFIGGLADDGLNVGLRIYGSQTDALEEGACQDVLRHQLHHSHRPGLCLSLFAVSELLNG